MLLAMAAGGPADSLLTRDADTVAEYIGLMSDEALLEDRDSASSKRWSQVRVDVCFASRSKFCELAKRVSNTCSDTVLVVLGAQTRPYLRKRALLQGGEVKRWVRG